MARIRAIIFDADGTLLDTREFIYQAFERTLASHGHAVPGREVMVEHMGKELSDMYQTFAPAGDIETLAEHHRKLHREELLPLVASYEGLHDLLQQMKMLGLKIGICTNRGDNARDLLKKIGIYDDLDAIVTSDDVESNKPHPEGIHKALEILHCDPHDAVMVGDTEVDIGAGKAAGARYTIGITHGFRTEKHLRAAGADFIATHLSEILPILERHL